MIVFNHEFKSNQMNIDQEEEEEEKKALRRRRSKKKIEN